MRASTLIVLMTQYCHMTSGDPRDLGGLGRLLHADKNESSAPCKDNSKPSCPDGSEPSYSSRPPSCSSGSLMCADGSTPGFGPLAEDGSNAKDGCKGRGGKGGKGGGDGRRRGGGDGRRRDRRLQNSQEGDSEECDEEEDDDGMRPVVLGSAIGGSVCGLCICVSICLFCRRRCVRQSKEAPNSESNGKVVTEPDTTFVVGHPLKGDIQNTKNTADGAPLKLGV